MEEWTATDYKAMRGYIYYTFELMNNDYRKRTGKPAIEREIISIFFNYIFEATGAMSFNQATNYINKIAQDNKPGTDKNS